MEARSSRLIEILLKKYLEGICTTNEKQQLFHFLSATDNENSFKEILLRDLIDFDEKQYSANATDFDRIYGYIMNEIKHNDAYKAENLRLTGKKKFRSILFYSSGVAAVFMLAFFLGSMFPLSDKADVSKPSHEVKYSEIKAPLGSKSEIKLPDGTEVMLNAGSTLRYPSDFNLNNRNLLLVGEAYFKVAKNINLPLNVNAGSISIKAVGTEFNVKAYDEEVIIETTLIEGKVEITQSDQDKTDNQYLDLVPNQKATYIKETDRFTLEILKSIDSVAAAPVKTIYENILISPKVDIDQVVAWTYGKLILRGENLVNLCVELQRKYDVNIIFKNEEIKKYRFSGVLLDETLEQVLNVIKLTAPIDYYLEGKTVFLSSDTDQIKNYSNHLK